MTPQQEDWLVKPSIP